MGTYSQIQEYVNNLEIDKVLSRSLVKISELTVPIIANLSHIMRKLDFCICQKKKAQISCAVTAQLISAFVFATQIVQFLFYYSQYFKPLACSCNCTG